MKRHTKILALAALGAAAVLSGCIKLTEITGPTNVVPNSVVELHVKGKITPETGYGPEGLALAILAPKEWDIANTAELFMSTSNLQNVFGIADLNEEKMVVMSDETFPKTTGDLAKFSGMTCAQVYSANNGDLGNVGGEVEWVIFKNSITQVTVNDSRPNGVDVDVKILLKVTSSPIKCNMFFEFFGEKEGWEGVGFKTNLTSKEIIVGDGSDDYSRYHLTSTVPSVYRYGDFFKVTFNTAIVGYDTALVGEKEVYMNGVAILADGRQVTMEKKDASTRMTNNGDGTFSKYIFPTHFFGLPKNTKISDLYLYFTNKDGNKVEKDIDNELGFNFKQSEK